MNSALEVDAIHRVARPGADEIGQLGSSAVPLIRRPHRSGPRSAQGSDDCQHD
jgi:hypothetical protein